MLPTLDQKMKKKKVMITPGMTITIWERLK